MAHIVTLEGPIAAGKTTLLKMLSNLPNIIVAEEPIDQWRNFHGINMLELFYQDMEKWGFKFQICALVTRTQELLQALEKASQETIIMVERSPLTDLKTFSTLLLENGFMSTEEFSLLQELHQSIPAWRNTQAILYLRISAEKCLKRIKLRGREEERNIDFGYLMRLGKLHDDCLLANPRTILLDGTETVEEVLTRIHAKIEQRASV